MKLWGSTNLEKSSFLPLVELEDELELEFELESEADFGLEFDLELEFVLEFLLLSVELSLSKTCESWMFSFKLLILTSLAVLAIISFTDAITVLSSALNFYMSSAFFLSERVMTQFICWAQDIKLLDISFCESTAMLW